MRDRGGVVVDARDARDVRARLTTARVRDEKYREALFEKINGVPTVYETLCALHGREDKPRVNGEASARNGGSSATSAGKVKAGADVKGANGGKAKKLKVDPVRLGRTRARNVAEVTVESRLVGAYA